MLFFRAYSIITEVSELRTSGNILINQNVNPVITQGITVEEAAVSSSNTTAGVSIGGNHVIGYRHGITVTLCNRPQLTDNKVYVNPALDGIWGSNNNLIDYLNGIALHGCYNAYLNNNGVTSSVPTLQGNPAPWMSWIASGFRVALSPKSTLCNNAAVDVVGGSPHYPSVPFEIGDPFEFHGNCFPSSFKLNTMENSTARGLYMGGMPIIPGSNSSTNGTIIGHQTDISGPPITLHARDNFWGNMNGGFHTDYNNVDGTYNVFWMTYSTAGFVNNSQNNITVPNDPDYSFQSNLLNNPSIPCASPILSPLMNQLNLDAYDDIANDSALVLGGNDTSRYFGKEFLYSQLRTDTTLYSNAVLAQFKDSMENSNSKLFSVIKDKLIYPMDSVVIDSLRNVLSTVISLNNIEENYLEVFELALKNPDLEFGVYSNSEIDRLRKIAKLCPYMDGSAVYSARVILRHFEPDVNYYNPCEFSKRPNRENSERLSKEVSGQNSVLFPQRMNNGKLVPNPNNGQFSVICPVDLLFNLAVYDSKGQRVIEQSTMPVNGTIHVDMTGFSPGIYNMILTGEVNRESFKFIISL